MVKKSGKEKIDMLNYREILENQINLLVEVQNQVLKNVSDGKERPAYTEMTLNTVMNSTVRIINLIDALKNLDKE